MCAFSFSLFRQGITKRQIFSKPLDRAKKVWYIGEAKGCDEDGLEHLAFQRGDGWCKSSAVFFVAHHFRAGGLKGFFRVDASRLAASRHKD